jgi:GntR family transcriptional repressor for pyruvate dehydrogenase complex
MSDKSAEVKHATPEMSRAARTVLPGRRNLSQVVASEIERRIKEGTYPVGHFAPTERELMAAFGVGRSTAREAMRVLVAAGLVDVRPGRGPLVLRTTAQHEQRRDPLDLSSMLADQSLADLYEFRLLLEVETASSAALRRTAEDLEVLQRLAGQFRLAVQSGLPTSELDQQFHLVVARASHNSVYGAALSAVSDKLHEARTMTETIGWARETGAIGHTDLVARIQAKDAQGARRVMANHILSGLAALEEAHGIEVAWPGRPDNRQRRARHRGAS